MEKGPYRSRVGYEGGRVTGTRWERDLLNLSKSVGRGLFDEGRRYNKKARLAAKSVGVGR